MGPGNGLLGPGGRSSSGARADGGGDRDPCAGRQVADILDTLSIYRDELAATDLRSGHESKCDGARSVQKEPCWGATERYLCQA